MLVLSRQRDETIMIGDDIEVTVVDVRGDKVRLGIKAPAGVPVHRKEVYLDIQRENRAAAEVAVEVAAAVEATPAVTVAPADRKPQATVRPEPRPEPPVQRKARSTRSPRRSASVW